MSVPTMDHTGERATEQATQEPREFPHCSGPSTLHAGTRNYVSINKHTHILIESNFEEWHWLPVFELLEMK